MELAELTPERINKERVLRMVQRAKKRRKARRVDPVMEINSRLSKEFYEDLETKNYYGHSEDLRKEIMEFVSES